MLEYGLIAGASAGVQGLFSAAIEGARLAADKLYELAAGNPIVSLLLLVALLGVFLLRRR
ncbi:MAG: hypothetical protein KJZ83_02680 [Burkholderiaceae bacterium]|nr:hypothetical protein [Burkholderiaceae bacterium]